MTDGKAISHSSDRLYDELLVTLVQSGDRAAADRLAKRWYPRLARTARRLLGSDELALEAVQECWVSFIKGMGRLRDPSRFAPWAFGIRRRRCADRIRANQSSPAMSELQDTVAASHELPDETLTIVQAFAGLPTDQRLAAQLFFVEELTLAEIAEVQGIPTGTAKSRLFHARQKLKAALTETIPGETP